VKEGKDSEIACPDTTSRLRKSHLVYRDGREQVRKWEAGIGEGNGGKGRCHKRIHACCTSLRFTLMITAPSICAS